MSKVGSYDMSLLLLTQTIRHDPEAEGAIVLKPPNKVHESKYNKRSVNVALSLCLGFEFTLIRGRPVVPVVLDPLLARHLRPHQVEG